MACLKRLMKLYAMIIKESQASVAQKSWEESYERDTTLSRHLSWQGGALCILMTQIAVEETVILHPTIHHPTMIDC